MDSFNTEKCTLKIDSYIENISELYVTMGLWRMPSMDVKFIISLKKDNENNFKPYIEGTTSYEVFLGPEI